jgi:hypothetical protein
MDGERVDEAADFFWLWLVSSCVSQGGSLHLHSSACAHTRFIRVAGAECGGTMCLALPQRLLSVVVLSAWQYPANGLGSRMHVVQSSESAGYRHCRNCLAFLAAYAVSYRGQRESGRERVYWELIKMVRADSELGKYLSVYQCPGYCTVEEEEEERRRRRKVHSTHYSQQSDEWDGRTDALTLGVTALEGETAKLPNNNFSLCPCQARSSCGTPHEREARE